MLQRSRIIFYVIIVALSMHVISLVLTQLSANSELTTSASNGAWYNKAAFVCDIALTFVSIYCFMVYRSFFPVFINACYLLLLLLIFIASFSDLSMFSKTPTSFYSPKGLGTWINFGILYFAVEDAYLRKIIKFFKYLCYGLFVFNLMRLATAGSISNRDAALDAVRDTAIVSIWVYPFFFLSDDDKTVGAKLLKYFLILLVAFFAFSIASRSYLLTIAIIMFIKLRRDFKDGRNKMIILSMAVVGLAAGYFLFSNIDKFGTVNDLFSIFTGRVNDDTRSGQLKEFMQQYKFDNLFTGVGPNASWNWSGDLKAPYQWLDNQFILLTWWFGIQTCIVYILFTYYSIFKKNPLRILDVTNAKITIFFWTLACAGWGIYVTYSTSLYYYFITILIGLVTVNVRHVTVHQLQNENVPEGIEENKLIVSGVNPF